METHRGAICSWSELGMDDKAPAHQHWQYWLSLYPTGITQTDIFKEKKLKI